MTKPQVTEEAVKSGLDIFCGTRETAHGASREERMRRVPEQYEASRDTDARSLGEAIINASNVADQTLAIDGNILVLTAPDGFVRIDLAAVEASRATPQGDWVEAKGSLPDDLFSHQDSWRNALVKCRDTAHGDDVSYWEHELAVFDRTYTALASAPAAPDPVETERGAIEGLIERLLDAQQDINLSANQHMDQSLCNASALINEVERALQSYAAAIRARKP